MKSIIKLTIALAAMVLPMANLKAQSLEPFSPYSEISPSYESYAMTRYGIVSPSTYTGAMSYSVPLYTYQDPDFTIPMSLEYNFDGYKPAQHSGTVGYGWFLNCGGTITREVRGFPDEQMSYGPNDRNHFGYLFSVRDGFSSASDNFVGYDGWSVFSSSMGAGAVSAEYAQSFNPFSNTPTHVAATYTPSGSWVNYAPNYTSVGANSYDMTPDIFHFSFLGHSGDFMIDPQGNIRVFNSDLPYGEISVSMTPEQGTHRAGEVAHSSIEITLGDGFRFRFGGSFPAMEFAASGNNSSGSSASWGLTPVAWRLTEIVAPNGRTVSFSYSQDKQAAKSAGKYYSLRYEGDTVHRQSMQYTSNATVFASVPDEIRVDGIAITEFRYTGTGADENAQGCFDNLLLFDMVPYSFHVAAPVVLSTITVRNSAGELVDRHTLHHRVASSGTPKIFLSSVSSLKDGATRFSYNLADITLPHNDTGSTDHWGYWNGRMGRDIRTTATFQGSRYNQMTDNWKEPSTTYSKAGAMTEILYPFGGSTSIEYEAHSAARGLDEEGQTYEPAGTQIAVGGLRVKSLTNKNNPQDSGDVTRYQYSDGFLFHMPRYVMTLPVSLHYIETYPYDDFGTPASNIRSAVINCNVTAYDADCNYSVSRDCIIGYGTVQVTHPDLSRTEHSFSGYSGDTADIYPDNMMYHTIAKRGTFGHLDWYDIGPDVMSSPYIASPVSDRRNMRGKPLCIKEYASDGTLLMQTDYTYSSHTVSLNWIFYNNLDSFIRSPWECLSPVLTEERTTDYRNVQAISKTRRLVYNQRGQVSSETLGSPQVPADEMVKEYLYLADAGSSQSASALPGALATAWMKRRVAGEEHLLMREDFSYAAPSIHTLPSAMTFSAGGSESRTTSFIRDSRLRITDVTLPGGETIHYQWSGNNIISKYRGTAANVTGYEWKDLIGITSMTTPAGQMMHYLYDGRNRPWKSKDTQLNTISENSYTLRYE